jgi:hypothetical protein
VKPFKKAIGHYTIKLPDLNLPTFIKVLDASRELQAFLHAKDFSFKDTSHLFINGSEYNSSAFTYIHKDLGKCEVRISIPIDNYTSYRIWSRNQQGERVWTTLEKLKNCHIPYRSLFLYFAGRFTEIPINDFEDLPF